MVLFYLTNATLDITSGVLWWVFKNTTYGIYSGTKYMIYGSEETEKDEDKKETDKILLEELKQIKTELKQIKENRE
jgi:hypothetical protein